MNIDVSTDFTDKHTVLQSIVQYIASKLCIVHCHMPYHIRIFVGLLSNTLQ